MLEVLDGGGLQMFFELHKQKKTICEDPTSFDFLIVHSPAYLPYPKMHLNCF
jgi:hypothetical protein